MHTSKHINNTTPTTTDEYTKIFNTLAILSIVGVCFIVYSIPALAEPIDDEVPSKLAAPDFSNINITAPDVSYAFEVEANHEAAKDIIDSAQNIMNYIDTVEPEAVTYEYVGEFYITMYAATIEQCGSTSGITASGRKCTEDPTCHTVAVDPKIIPLGSYLKIDGWPGVYRADDTGSAIQNYDIDIYTDSEQESKQFNNQSGVKVWIIKD